MADIIPTEFQQFVQLAVASGEYASEGDVVAAGLRLLHERKVRLEKLRAELQIGRDQLDRGEFTEHDEESLRELFDEIQEAGQSRYNASKTVR
jgi:putative addiction module CopG family antidote